MEDSASDYASSSYTPPQVRTTDYEVLQLFK